MARMPGVTYRPVPNYTKNGQISVRGVVVHIMAGTLAGTDSWFRNPRSQASSHFGTGKTGTLYQWVDTAHRAWAQAAGNRDWLSVENEGKGGDRLTDAQLDRNAEVLAWAHKTYDVPLKVASGTSDRGLGWHGMGGSSWGGHTSCPGSKIVAQLPEIVKRAKAIVGGKAPTPTKPTPAKPATGGSSTPARYQTTINGLAYGYGATGSHVTRVGRELVKRGFGRHYAVGPGPNWSDADTRNYAAFQRSLGYSGKDADGVPGESSLKRLLGTLPAKAAPRPRYEPFPGAAFFSPGRRSPIITAMGRRLVAEGCSRYRHGPGPHWTNVDRASYAAWQRKLGFTGAAADGIPGKTSWDKLRVPKQL